MIPNLTIPVLNRYDLLHRCLDSIDEPIENLLIVNNGQDYRARLTKHPMAGRVWWLDMPSNFGVAASWNLAVKSFRHDPVWFFASNDVVFQPGALANLAKLASPNQLTLSEMFPHFHAFALGEEVVKRIGLFDENIYPAFEEDIEYLGRIAREGLPVVKADVPAHHDNSSTIHSDIRYRDANSVTHGYNREYMLQKEAGLIPLTESRWRLDRWRRQDWR